VTQVVKNYSVQFRGLSISPDGQLIGATVAWVDDTNQSAGKSSRPPSTVPGSISHLRVLAKTGAVMLNDASVGTIDAATLKNAAAVATAVGALIQSLVASGKIPTP
jgi:hypothetical protein